MAAEHLFIFSKHALNDSFRNERTVGLGSLFSELLKSSIIQRKKKIKNIVLSESKESKLLK